METALYFPYIRIPESSWFTQVLLYWDGAASIVPRNMRDYEVGLGKYMYGLMEAGLLRPVAPDEFKGNDRELTDRFLALLEASKFPKICKPGKMEAGPKTLRYPERWTRIHKGKASMGLAIELNSRGLACSLGDFPRKPGARRDPNDPSWWFAFENKVAELYMAYMIGSLCRVDESLFPVTDTKSSLHSLVEPTGGDAASRLRELRYATIMQILPVPSRPVPADELASFKDRHGDQLRRLRRYLNGKLVDLAAIDDDFVRDTKTESVLQEIHDDVAVLAEQMNKKRWPRIVFVGVGGLVASAAAVGLTIASGGTALAVGLGVTGGVASLGPAGYQAVDHVRSRRFDKDSPLAYAALAQAL
jgi:hypothetical protein